MEVHQRGHHPGRGDHVPGEEDPGRDRLPQPLGQRVDHRPEQHRQAAAEHEDEGQHPLFPLRQREEARHRQAEEHEADEVHDGVAHHQRRGDRHRAEAPHPVEERGPQHGGRAQRHPDRQVHHQEPHHRDHGADHAHRDSLPQRVAAAA